MKKIKLPPFLSFKSFTHNQEEKKNIWSHNSFRLWIHISLSFNSSFTVTNFLSKVIYKFDFTIEIASLFLLVALFVQVSEDWAYYDFRGWFVILIKENAKASNSKLFARIFISSQINPNFTRFCLCVFCSVDEKKLRNGKEFHKLE